MTYLQELYELVRDLIPAGIWQDVYNWGCAALLIGFVLFLFIKSCISKNSAKKASAMNEIRLLMQTAAQAAEQAKAKDGVQGLSGDAKRKLVLSEVSLACIEHGIEYVESVWDSELTEYISGTKIVNS